MLQHVVLCCSVLQCAAVCCFSTTHGSYFAPSGKDRLAGTKLGERDGASALSGFHSIPQIQRHLLSTLAHVRTWKASVPYSNVDTIEFGTYISHSDVQSVESKCSIFQCRHHRICCPTFQNSNVDTIEHAVLHSVESKCSIFQRGHHRIRNLHCAFRCGERGKQGPPNMWDRVASRECRGTISLSQFRPCQPVFSRDSTLSHIFSGQCGIPRICGIEWNLNR